MYVEELKYSLRWKKAVANSVQKTNKLKAHLQNWLRDKECIKVFLFLFFVVFFSFTFKCIACSMCDLDRLVQLFKCIHWK